MDSRELFGVSVRSIGLLMLVYGIYAGAHTVIEIIGVRTRIQEPYLAGAILSAFWIGAAFVLFFCADDIVRLAYRSRSN